MSVPPIVFCLFASLILSCAHAQQTDALRKQFQETKAKAENGDAVAQSWLSASYANGAGVEQDYVEAAKWARKAADQNDLQAQFDLGSSYYNGLGVKKDFLEAVKWFRKAAEQNYAPAQNNLGLCYANGLGVEKDYTEAALWHRKAAEQDEVWAQTNLGLCYANARGVEQNQVEAYAWLNLSAKMDERAAEARDALEKTMSPQQVNDAQKRTRELRTQIDEQIKKNGRLAFTNTSKLKKEIENRNPQESQKTASARISRRPAIAPATPNVGPFDEATKIKLLKERGLDPAFHDIRDDGVIMRYNVAIRQPPPATVQIPKGTKYIIFVSRANGGNDAYYSKEKPQVFGSGYKIMDLSTKSEVIVLEGLQIFSVDDEGKVVPSK